MVHLTLIIFYSLLQSLMGITSFVAEDTHRFIVREHLETGMLNVIMTLKGVQSMMLKIFILYSSYCSM